MTIKPRESLPYGLGRFKQTIKRLVVPVIQSIRFGGRSSADEISELEQQRLRSHVPVFVFQMGKVASTSIYRSLQQQYQGSVFHAHYFSAHHNDTGIRNLFRYVEAESPAIKIVSLVRDPFSRNISAFFQNFKRDTGMEIKQCRKSMLQLREMFLKNYPHEIPWIWFDNNIKKHFGIDVYEHPFPKSGYVQIRQGNVDLLLLKHDLADGLKQELVGQFVGVPDFQIVRSNVSAEKEYSEYMQAFGQLKMPLWYLHRVCSTKYTKHFYYHQMLELMEQWREPEENAA